MGFLTLVVWCLIAIENSIIPTLVAISETEVAKVANQAVIDAINSNIEKLLSGKKLLNFEVNEAGEILYVEANTGDLNRIQAEALSVLQATLGQLEGFSIYVPLGQTLGSRIFAPVGPKIKVTLFPYGSVSVQVKDSFEVTGINQAKFEVSLFVTCSVRVVIPLISSKTTVASEIPLATVIIPGKVPETYISIPGNNPPSFSR
ncbi:MAG: sporulation protein YunB [Candidatus Fermentithermobacillus carboniphilus]|uniref:Sporulation protein YunB n=1 Tax=Candidatus Fermentithermobacillus carboniphilus TaxID=3085328 RepID=A0AAT9LBQ1_9FIRM|nr:MAG: sporulation protein YunB [Candidatus Fermentithermobacillus carboniphilus]